MTRLGALLAFLGFGSAVLHFLDVRQIALMAWAGPWQPFLGLGVGAVGAVLLLIPLLTNQDEPASEGYGPPPGAPGGPAPQAAFGQQGFPPPAGYGPPPASPPGGFPQQPGYGPPGGFGPPPIPQQGPQYGPRPPQGPPPPRGPVQDFGPQGGPPFGPQGR